MSLEKFENYDPSRDIEHWHWWHQTC